jgi:hypothetical protein
MRAMYPVTDLHLAITPYCGHHTLRQALPSVLHAKNYKVTRAFSVL